MPCMIVRISFCSNSVIMPTARCHLKRPVFVSFRVQNRSQECSIRCYIRGQRMSKIIHENWIQGQRGVNFVERVVLDMGFTWEATRVDVGVDGQIEIRDPTTGAMKNWILRAQVKERQSFVRETPESFEFVCDEDDLSYWLGGTTPNILIVCRPSTNEAYWISIRDYFRDPVVRKSRRVLFDKRKNRFSKDSAPELI